MIHKLIVHPSKYVFFSPLFSSELKCRASARRRRSAELLQRKAQLGECPCITLVWSGTSFTSDRRLELKDVQLRLTGINFAAINQLD